MIKLRCTQAMCYFKDGLIHANVDVRLRKVTDLTFVDLPEGRLAVEFDYYDDDAKKSLVRRWVLDNRDAQEEIAQAYNALKRIALNLQGTIYLPKMEDLAE